MDVNIRDYIGREKELTAEQVRKLPEGTTVRLHSFDRLYERNPKEWDFWMNRCCTDENGNKYGWGRVLDYVEIEWRNPAHWWMEPNQIKGQMTLFDYV